MDVNTSQATDLQAVGGSRPSGPTDATRRRWELWLWPAAGVGAAGVIMARDPNVAGSYGFCPLLATTGLDCPFCGGLRGTHALIQGDLATALDHNLLLPLFLVAGLLGIVGMLRGGGTRSPRTRWLWWGLAAVTAIFFVVRNLPWFPFLDSSV